MFMAEMRGEDVNSTYTTPFASQPVEINGEDSDDEELEPIDVALISDPDPVAAPASSARRSQRRSRSPDVEEIDVPRKIKRNHD
jgi:hypothetical protein